MLEKHLKRIKKSNTGNPTEDEWEEIPTLGQKIEDQIIEEVPDRSIKIERRHKTNLESYEEDAPKLKDQFDNAAQYSELIKKYVKEKELDFDKFKKKSQQFDKEILELKPQKQKVKFDLNKLNYKDIKVQKLNQDLVNLEAERVEIKNKISYFTNQIKQAESELSFKVEQIEDIKLELKRIEKKEALQKEIKTEQEAIDIIKNELESIGDIKESKRIFRTVNSLVDLLNEKNNATINELNSVKNEFSELQKKYLELMSKLK